MPQDPTASCDVAVIGGGVIGLAVAWRAAQRGHAVCVLERGELGAGASRVAAGMLAPVTEADAGELALLELGLRSARAWPQFAAQLEAAAGADPGLRRSGALVVARDRDEAEALERELALRVGLGLEVERLLPSAARRLEPALAPDAAARARRAGRPLGRSARARARARRGGAPRRRHAADEHERSSAIDPQRRSRHRRAAGRRRARPRRAGRCRGRRLERRDRGLAADPAASGQGPDPAPARSRRRRAARAHRAMGPAHPRLPRSARRRALRARRDDGGARLRRDGHRRRPLRAAARRRPRSFPACTSSSSRRPPPACVPRRPTTRRCSGPSAELEGLHWATGHHRNGILLAPVTAEIVVDGLDGGDGAAPPAFAAERFGAVHA